MATTTNKTATFIARIMRAPGAWAGSDGMGSFGYTAHVTVDAKRAADAIRWLSRRCEIVGTSLSIGMPGGLKIECNPRTR